MLWVNSNEAYAYINYDSCDNYSWKLDILFFCHEEKKKKFCKQGRLNLPQEVNEVWQTKEVRLSPKSSWSMQLRQIRLKSKKWMNFATKGDLDDVPMKWMKLGKEGRLDFNPKEWKKCATKGRLNFTPKKWMKFATKGDPRLTQKNEWGLLANKWG